jgi:hypothetical protein
VPRPSHSSRFYHPHSSGWGVQIMELGGQIHVLHLIQFSVNLPFMGSVDKHGRVRQATDGNVMRCSKDAIWMLDN